MSFFHHPNSFSNLERKGNAIEELLGFRKSLLFSLTTLQFEKNFKEKCDGS